MRLDHPWLTSAQSVFQLGAVLLCLAFTPPTWAADAEEDRLHVHDLHATILWLLGLDNMGLTYRYKGRPERPTQSEGEPFRRIVG